MHDCIVIHTLKDSIYHCYQKYIYAKNGMNHIVKTNNSTRYIFLLNIINISLQYNLLCYLYCNSTVRPYYPRYLGVLNFGLKNRG